MVQSTAKKPEGFLLLAISFDCFPYQVFEPQLQEQLYPHLCELKPRPSIYCKDFIAANQEDRADNVLSG